MEKVSPQEALKAIDEELGFRSLAVSVLRMITSKDPIFILETKERANWFRVVSDQILDGENIKFMNPSHERNEFTFVDTETFKKNWKQFSGREICIVEQELSVKNPGVNLLIEHLTELHRKSSTSKQPSTEFLTKVHQFVTRISKTVVEITRVIKIKDPDHSKRRRNLKAIFQSNLKSNREKQLVFHILELSTGRMFGK